MHLACRSEVQALDSCVGGDGCELLAAVDGYGCVTLARDAAGTADSADSSHHHPGAVASLQPPHGSYEPSWAGCAFAPGAPYALATARTLARCVDLYDGDLHVRALHTPSYPAALAFLPPSGAAGGAGTLLAVAEAACISLWDMRAPSCVSRWGAGSTPSPLLALATGLAPAGYPLLASCGAERALVVYDARAGRPLRRINGFMRKDVTALRFSSVDTRTVYAAGQDNQVTCRRWDTAPDTLAGPPDRDKLPGGWAFRGDARWAGLALSGAQGGDTIAAISASGALAAAHVTAG